MDEADVAITTPLWDIQQKPHWRYERALELLTPISGRRRAATQRDDVVVRNYVRYAVERDRINRSKLAPSTQQQKLRDRYGAIWQADRLYNGGMMTRAQSEVEAMFLARIPVQEISARTGMLASSLNIYHDMFFCVRPRIDQRTWISNVIIGQIVQSGESPWEIPTLLKYFAYFGGPLMLDVVMNGAVTGSLWAEDTESVAIGLENFVKTRLSATMATLMVKYQPRSFDVADMTANFVSLMSLAQRQRATVGEDNVLTDAMKVLLSRIRIPMGDEPKLPVTLEATYTNKAVEPRASERAAIAAGEMPDTLTQYNQPEWTLRPEVKNDKPKPKPPPNLK